MTDPLNFSGTCGITNTLIGLFGTEAVFEFRRERIWHAETDTAEEDDVRQILPVLVVSQPNRITPDTASETAAGLRLLVPAANLRHRFRPGVTRVLFRRRVWLLRAAAPHYAGSRVHLWDLELVEI